jgi:1-deoxy-D-xylulose-5-phosphate synthase
MLELINDEKLKKMSLPQLKLLCEELRDKIINTVMNNGGHLSSNLGMVELTVALHYVFDFPADKIIFDVGHQCYSHKLLSGRYAQFDTIRKKGGLSGFPKREESEYDCYNTGHAGTSISAALGIAKARDIKGEDFNVIAVIGDGSFNNGLVYEAFNSLKPLNSNIFVILNDNGMSISPTVGSMHEYLEILAKDEQFANKKQKHANIFERFGFLYDGVYDGNNLEEMIAKLSEIKEQLKTRSVILHIATKKGKGYAFCEENPQQTHGISSKSKTKKADCEKSYDEFYRADGKEYSKVLGERLCALAQNDKRIVAVTAAMTPSLGLSEFFEKYPDRAMDVGICEEHATILCAALATQGLKPYYAVYSTFLQRSFDEIIIDICSQNLPVTLCIDRAGVSGADGDTHQGVFDLSFLNFIPNLYVAVPKDIAEFERIIDFSAHFDKPLAIRYPRECTHAYPVDSQTEITRWQMLVENSGNFVILACGERMVAKGYEVCKKLASEGIGVSLINARFVKPLDTETLNKLNQKFIITLEDNMLFGGFASLVDTYFSESDKTVKNFGYADKFIPHGGVDELIDEYGVNVKDIISYIKTNADR